MDYFDDSTAIKIVLDNLAALKPTFLRFINQISEEELAGLIKLVAKLGQLVIKQKSNVR